jgi:hypothetical protein
MSGNVKDAILPILMKMQEELTALRREQTEFRAENATRFQRLEQLGHRQRRDMAGVLVMMKSTVGDFDERVSQLEARVAKLEAARN